MRTIARRVLHAVLLLWAVLTITFLLLHAAPGDPSTVLIPPSASAADIARERARLGLDEPLVVQYARWGGGILKGDLGESFTYHRPVLAVLGDALPISLALGAASLLLTFVIGVAVGGYQASRRGRPVDGVLTVVSTAAYAAPSFWLALLLVAVFTYGAARWGLPPWLRLPAFGVRDPSGDARGIAAVLDVLRHAVLPVATLAAVGAAGVARYARTILADVSGAGFVRTARAKGASAARVQLHHVLPNAAPPLVVLFALSLPGVLAGSVFVETVFAWPGMGRLMVNAITARDYPLVMGAAAIYAAAVIGANLAADLALPLMDPRMRDDAR